MMRKSLLFASMFAIGVGCNGVYAQKGNGGFPLSFKTPVEEASLGLTTISNATFDAYLNGTLSGNSEKYEVGWAIPAAMDLMKGGIWKDMPDGSKIYTTSIKVANAKALALYYKDFFLPKGVSLYLYNANHKQVLGAYDYTTSADSRVFSNQPVIGEIVHVELNIQPGAEISKIALGLDFVGAYYRGVEHEAILYADETPLLFDPAIGASAACHTNAMCPQGNAQEEARKATLRIVIADGPNNPLGFCSGTLINNTGNEPNGTCKPLFLTASHCDEENGMTDAHFQYWQFRFNYQMDACTGGNVPTETSSPTMTSGAKFKARSYYPTFPSSNPESSSLVQDFLLLELNGTLPSGYHLIGWNRSTSLTSDPGQSMFYGFHHPAGDVKKLSVGTEIAGNGTFNQSTVAGTHWKMVFGIGGTSPGSSGSGLFDAHGLLVGDLSGGATGNCPTDAKKYGNDALYSKISYAWENAFDQTQFPAQAGSGSRLKDHLDPLNLGLGWLGTTESDHCSDFTSVKVNQQSTLDVHVFPVPTNNGKLNIQLNVSKIADFAGTIVDVSGREVQKFKFNNRSTNLKSLDLSQLTNGIYFLTLSSELGHGQYKFVITK